MTNKPKARKRSTKIANWKGPAKGANIKADVVRMAKAICETPAPLMDPRVDAMRRAIADIGVTLSAQNDALNRIVGLPGHENPIALLRETMEDCEALLGAIMFGEGATEKQRKRFGLIHRRRFDRLLERVESLERELRDVRRDESDAVSEYIGKLEVANEENDRLRRVIHVLEPDHDDALPPREKRRHL